MATTPNKLRFLSGVSANITPEKTPINNGSVYVTTDEHIMYVDLEGERLRLSDIVWVSTQSQLPAKPPADRKRALYYVETDNILLRYNQDDNAPDWTQINAYPQLQQIIKSSAVTYSTITDGASAKLTLKDKKDHDVTANFKVNVTSGSPNTINVSQNNNSIVIKGSDTITSSAISASYDDNTKYSIITITDTTTGYNADGTVKTGTNSSAVKIFGDGLASSVTGDTILLKTLPQTITPEFDASGAFKITYVAPDGHTKDSETITPKVKVGKGSVKTEAQFVNGVADLSGVYTAQEVDDAIAAQLKTANAMVFQGTVSPTKNLPVSAPLGATYIVDAPGKIGTSASNIIAQNAKVGDMFIASGEERADGTIATVDWKYVPAGNDDIPMYSTTITADKLALVEALAGKNNEIGAIAVGSKLSGGVSGKTLTINHATQNVTTTTPTQETDSYTNQIVAVSNVGYDTYGHINSLTTTTYKIPNFNLHTITYAAAATANTATVTNTVTLANGNSKSGTFSVKSDNLEVTASGQAITINAVWGTF